MFKKIASNTISQIFSKVWTAIISIFLISILTKYLPMNLYGLYNKVYNYLGIFAFLADLGLYTIAIREITNNEEDTSKIVGNILTLRFLLWLLIMILALVIAYFLPWYNSKLALVSIFIVSIFTVVSLLNSAIMALMQSYMKIEFSLLSTILWKILNVSLVGLVVYLLFPRNSILNFDMSFVGIMIAWLAWITLNTWLNFRYAKRLCSVRFGFDFDYIKYIFKISIPYGMALFLSVVYFKIDIILLWVIEWWKVADDSIALYSLPMKIVEVLMVMWGFYLNSIMPSLTKFYKDGDSGKLDSILQISLKVLFSFWILVFVLWVLFRDHVIMIIANENYLDSLLAYNSSDVFPIVLWVLVFYFLSLVFIYSLITVKKQSLLLNINIVIAIFNIIWNIIFIPKYSFMWAWFVTLFSQVLLMVLWYIYSSRYIKIKLPLLFLFKVVILWIVTYVLWYFLLVDYSIGLYLDLSVYGVLLLFIYILGVYLLLWFKKEFKELS